MTLAALRKMCGMSLEKLAELSNVSRSHISAIEAPGVLFARSPLRSFAILQMS